MLDITKLLSVMAEHNASDIYLTVDSPPMYRINGVLRPAGNRLLTAQDTETLANSVMSDKQQKEFSAHNEMNLGLYYSALGRFRVNIFRQKSCVGVVIRQKPLGPRPLNKEQQARPEIPVRQLGQFQEMPASPVSHSIGEHRRLPAEKGTGFHLYHRLLLAAP